MNVIVDIGMSNRDRSLTASFVIFLALLAVTVGVTVGLKRSATVDRGETATSASAHSNVTPTPILKPNTSVRPSSKADKNAWLESKQLPQGTSYSFSVSDASGANKRQLYTVTEPIGTTIELPYNTWAPDDNHLFLEVKETGRAPNYWVFQQSGAAFADGAQYLDVGTLWSDKKVPFTIRTATGWASETLLIIYTFKDDGSKGPAYWFDLPSRSFLQLAS